MNQPIDIVKKLFSEVKRQFPRTRLRYEFNPRSQTHFVEVFPFELFHSEEFARLGLRYTDQFVESFGAEQDICFISEDSLTKLSGESLTEADIFEKDFMVPLEMGNWRHQPVIAEVHSKGFDFTLDIIDEEEKRLMRNLVLGNWIQSIIQVSGSTTVYIDDNVTSIPIEGTNMTFIVGAQEEKSESQGFFERFWRHFETSEKRALSAWAVAKAGAINPLIHFAGHWQPESYFRVDSEPDFHKRVGTYSYQPEILQIGQPS